ncbi:MAG: GTP 3',8-cyclase MoaA [Gammaproteobacteria bacterium]|nr:GTP 3',8-cyclase MoaA [Gammaproteobacteria bacterium]
MNQLIDPFKRPIEYVRLSVTDRCDLRCFYCMPEDHHQFQEPAEWLSFDEIQRVIGAFTRLGVSRIRITGGEPLVRRNVDQLVEKLAVLPGLDDLSMSTNAVSLSRFAQPLYAAGVRRLNVSLDTLQAERFKTITKGKLDKVIKGLMAAKEAGFSPIKINMVVMKGINDDEVEDMVEFCLKHDFTLRFIETMPMGSSGLEATDHYQDLQEIKHRLQQHYDLIPSFMPGGGPARYFNIAGSKANIGFITPISQHFCDTCNRVRLSADGTLYMCLGQEHNFPLRPLLRAGISDHELENAIRAAIDLKPEKHEFNEKPEQVVRFMSFTGG